jgi:hypothetical protein
MAKHIVHKIGSSSFIVGFVLSLFVGVVQTYFGKVSAVTVSTVILMGIIVGLINITGKESINFLLATVALVIVTKIGGDILMKVITIGPYLENIFNSIMIFVSAATMIVALKLIYDLAKDV